MTTLVQAPYDRQDTLPGCLSGQSERCSRDWAGRKNVRPPLAATGRCRPVPAPVRGSTRPGGWLSRAGAADLPVRVFLGARPGERSWDGAGRRGSADSYSSPLPRRDSPPHDLVVVVGLGRTTRSLPLRYSRAERLRCGSTTGRAYRATGRAARSPTAIRLNRECDRLFATQGERPSPTIHRGCGRASAPAQRFYRNR